MDYNHPLVIDNGTSVIKVGFAGDEEPNLIIPNVVGIPKYESLQLSNQDRNIKNIKYVGLDVKEKRGLCKLNYPIEHGIVTNWNNMELILESIFTNDTLRLSQSQHPVLITEPALNPSVNKHKLLEDLFEKYHVPAVKIYPAVF